MENSLYDSDRPKIILKDVEGIRFVQNYQDEYFDVEALGEERGLGWNGLSLNVKITAEGNSKEDFYEE